MALGIDLSKGNLAQIKSYAHVIEGDIVFKNEIFLIIGECEVLVEQLYHQENPEPIVPKEPGWILYDQRRGREFRISKNYVNVLDRQRTTC